MEYTDEFGAWWETLSEGDQISVGAHVGKLEQRGPNLPFPYSSGIAGSRHAHIQELRVQSGGKPLRVFYAFDPRRQDRRRALLRADDSHRRRPIRHAPD